MEARVEVGGDVVGAIEKGLLILVCAEPEDDNNIVKRLAGKISKLRIFEDDKGKMNLSIKEIRGKALVVSQFTLAADMRKGNRPSFTGAAPPPLAEALYEAFVSQMREEGVGAETGRFGKTMQIHLINDGPVTIWMDSSTL
jgi:D-tyrosyl-tRNA(Tyr) deacylase